jgi:hypothetical protein
MRRHISYANVVATLALVFAMSGGALAAKHYLVTKTSQLSPQVLRKLKGNAGPKGPSGKGGAPGAPGAQGVPGQKGETGKEGPSALRPLESGHTVTGYFGGRFEVGSGARVVGVSVSLPIPAPVSINRVELAPTANCTGSSQDPTALPGFACVYPNILVLAEKVEPSPGDAGGDRFGFFVDWTGEFANTQTSVRGTWAYTAP